ncbi:MAG: GGDEF domain-containing protein, partial [Leucobacter sp.]
MTLRRVEDSPVQNSEISLRLSSRLYLAWGAVWTILVALALFAFWARALPIQEPTWVLVVFISITASSTYLVAISKLDTTLVLSPASISLFIALESTDWAEALALWSTAYLIGMAIRFRHWSETAETIAYMLCSALVASTVLSSLEELGTPRFVNAVAFVSVYLLSRFAISMFRLTVATSLGFRDVLAGTLVLRMSLAWGVLSVVAIAAEEAQRLLGSFYTGLDMHRSGATVIFLLGISSLVAATYLESRIVSAQLSGTLAAANGLPWSARTGIEQHALAYARLALPRYKIEVRDDARRGPNEIVSPLGDGRLVAKRGTAQRPFLVQDQRVLDAIAHIAETMAATYQEHDRLAHSAVTDDLTGLPNYRGFREILTRAAETAAEGLAIAYIDVDHFKEVNDTHGHEAGNTVLRTLAARLRSRCAANEFVARIGGDEFVLVLADVATEEAGRLRAKELIGEASAPIVLPDAVIALSLSAGVAFAEPGAVDITSLVETADARMYAERGRQIEGDSSALPDPRGGQDVIALVELIKSAIEERRLVVMYQPIVDAVEDR